MEAVGPCIRSSDAVSPIYRISMPRRKTGGLYFFPKPDLHRTSNCVVDDDLAIFYHSLVRPKRFTNYT